MNVVITFEFHNGNKFVDQLGNYEQYMVFCVRVSSKFCGGLLYVVSLSHEHIQTAISAINHVPLSQIR